MKMIIDRHWVYPSVALIAFVIGLEAANTFISFEPKSGDAATWFGAVGTFLAFGATVWVATDQTRQKNLEAHNRAVLTAARLLPRLNNFIAVVARVCKNIEEQVTLETDYSIAQEDLQAACDWSTDEILPLITLPNDVAYRLEVVASLLPILTEKITQDIEIAAKRAAFVEDYEAEISRARDAGKEFGRALENLGISVVIVNEELKRILPRIHNNLPSD